MYMMPGSVAESKVVKEVKHPKKTSSQNCFKLAAGFKNKKKHVKKSLEERQVWGDFLWTSETVHSSFSQRN